MSFLLFGLLQNRLSQISVSYFNYLKYICSRINAWFQNKYVMLSSIYLLLNDYLKITKYYYYLKIICYQSSHSAFLKDWRRYLRRFFILHYIERNENIFVFDTAKFALLANVIFQNNNCWHGPLRLVIIRFYDCSILQYFAVHSLSLSPNGLKENFMKFDFY